MVNQNINRTWLDHQDSQWSLPIVVRVNREAQVTWQTLVLELPSGRQDRARTDEMEAQRGARPTLSFLQKTGRPQTRNRISHRLPPEHPAGHREAQCRVTQMHEPHKYPQTNTPKHPNRPITSGEDQHHYLQNSSGITAEQGLTVPFRWHESNRAYPASALRHALAESVSLQRVLLQRVSFVSVRVSEHPYFQRLPSDLRVGPQRWKDCFRRSASGRPPDRGAANPPSD